MHTADLDTPVDAHTWYEEAYSWLGNIKSKRSQLEEEIVPFALCMAHLEVQSTLEIGSRFGETLLILSKFLSPPCTFVGIDLPNSKWGRANSRGHLERVMAHLTEQGHEARVVWGDSRDPKTIEAVRGSYDLVFIDGDHTYPGVLADYQNYAPMARRYVALHDVAAPNCVKQKRLGGLGVPRLWQEVKQGTAPLYVSEFVSSRRGPYGIGMLDIAGGIPWPQ